MKPIKQTRWGMYTIYIPHKDRELSIDGPRELDLRYAGSKGQDHIHTWYTVAATSKSDALSRVIKKVQGG